ncbi:hypothetical protein Tco_1022967 [Tanacetum coccineum]
MAAVAIKHMASNFAKLDKFEGVDFRRWQKKMHFLISSMRGVYVLTTPIPEDGLILNGMSGPLFDIYQNVESSKDLWVSLEAKYMAEDASSNSSLFTQHKMNMDEAIQDDNVAWWVDSGATVHVHVMYHGRKQKNI